MLKKISAVLSFMGSVILIALFGLLIIQTKKPTLWLKYVAPLLVILNGFNLFYILKTGFGWDKEISQIERENQVIQKQIQQAELKKRLQEVNKDLE